MDVESLIDDMNSCSILEDDNHSTSRMISHIRKMNIENFVKKHLISLIQNDCVNSYIDIYNICLENDIELPPF